MADRRLSLKAMLALGLAGIMAGACSSGTPANPEVVAAPTGSVSTSPDGVNTADASGTASTQSSPPALVVVDIGPKSVDRADDPPAADSNPTGDDGPQPNSNPTADDDTPPDSNPTADDDTPPDSNPTADDDTPPDSTASSTSSSTTTTTTTTAPLSTTSTVATPTRSSPFAGLPFSSGEVVAADYANGPDAMSIWSYVTNGHHAGNTPYDHGSDTQIIHHGGGGDPLPAMDGRVHNGYRRLQTFGPQALWDAENQPDHTRSQLGGWGETSSLHLFRPGQRTFVVFSVRLDPDTPIQSTVVGRRGLAHLSKVSQFKSVLPGSGGPMISVDEGRDGLRLIYRGNGVTHEEVITGVPRGSWLRLGIDVHWAENGALRWWGDLDGDRERDFKPLSPQVKASTILPGSGAAAFNIGPYHMLVVPKNGRDYANVEVLLHPLSDPW